MTKAEEQKKIKGYVSILAKAEDRLADIESWSKGALQEAQDTVKLLTKMNAEAKSHRMAIYNHGKALERLAGIR